MELKHLVHIPYSTETGTGCLKGKGLSQSYTEERMGAG